MIVGQRINLGAWALYFGFETCYEAVILSNYFFIAPIKSINQCCYARMALCSLIFGTCKHKNLHVCATLSLELPTYHFLGCQHRYVHQRSNQLGNIGSKWVHTCCSVPYICLAALPQYALCSDKLRLSHTIYSGTA